mgnify:CR=1 FL=1|nr:MAG TPA: hypothetical protein [Caudoviricetes sp.]
MTPIINPWLFYLVDVIDSFKFAIFLLLILFTLIFGVQAIIENNNEEDEVKVIKAIKKMFIVATLVITFSTFIPSKKTCYQMMIASQVTEENIQKAEDTIKKSVDYIFEKINEGK